MTMQPDNSPDEFLFADESASEHADGALSLGAPRIWTVMVIDDDADVHQATRFALEGAVLFERRIQLMHAHSAAQARDLLMTQPDIALVLLDVVMETADAGLQLVDFIRNVSGHRTSRIVLRTGQPGYAPELETLLRYDINDYKTKSELTHHKLITTVAAALRSYDQLCTIEASRRGLELIVQASGAFLEPQGLSNFAAGVITQMAAILGVRPEGLVCAQGERNGGQYRVLAAAGHYAPLIDQPLDALYDQRVSQLLRQCLEEGRSQYGPNESVLYLGVKGGLDMAAFVSSNQVLSEVDCSLLDVFCVNLNACLRNLALVQRLHTEAYVDALLRLPNRTKFIEDINQVIQTGPGGHSVVLVDVDDFASVNDMMGHAYADLLLHAIAHRLKSLLAADIVLARVSGNTFGLLGLADKVAPKRVLAMLQEPLQVAGQPHRISATLGVCHLDDTSSSGADWLKNASIALKQAKRESRGQFVFFSKEMASLARSRAQLLSNLHTAFDQDRLFLAFQPQVDLQTQELIGLEALMRWRGDDGRMVPPDTFIPVAEQSGLIISLGDWVMQTACLTMRRLLAMGMAPRRMAVNVSVVQFQSPGFVERVYAALASADLTGEQLELEITESVAMLGAGVVEPILTTLRERGISVAIDDFGTGYSSLAYLERLPLDRIKIDKAFVYQLSTPGGPRIAEMITQLGNKLGLRVLAEGIEDDATWRALQDMGCHEGQGYFIAKPMETAVLTDWLANRRSLQVAGSGG
ncbi:MAG TPA: EAL domain-containing protein [Burkholderiaceae bacterium]|nr:EAL domain-containing protein [Burkholderiaceae bacterium]